MSELINNSAYRKAVLKDIIKALHAGEDVEAVKEKFAELVKEVTPSEISDMEQDLMQDGITVQEVQKLCDVHAAIFKGSIKEIHSPQSIDKIPGHPLHTFKLENEALTSLIEKEIEERIDSNTIDFLTLRGAVEKLAELDRHYKRKENLLFPYLEAHGVTGPTKVMWGKDDEVIAQLRSVLRTGRTLNALTPNYLDEIKALTHGIKEMIFKEENILFPMSLETLTEEEWYGVEKESNDFGYCLVEPLGKWKPESKAEKNPATQEVSGGVDGNLKLSSGYLDLKQIEALLNHLPLDITFIDEHDKVRYFSLGKERIFPRTQAVIGRDVHNCHPPASVHVVEKILDSFKNGEKDSEEFYIKMGPRYVYIRYYAVRDEASRYMGTLEVTQDIGPIQAITGEKRLLSE